MNHFVSMYGAFHTNENFHKKIAYISYQVIKELEPDALDNFLHCESGLGNEYNLKLAMKIVYNILEFEIKDFYGYEISKEEFIQRVVLEN